MHTNQERRFNAANVKGKPVLWLRVSEKFNDAIRLRANEDGTTISRAIEAYALIGLRKTAARREAGK